jgi:hypothetical protein
MKTKRIYSLSLAIAAIALFTSCSVRYTYFIENTTPYRIDYALIDNQKKFSLDPGEIAGPFEGYHERGAASFFAQPMFFLSVTEYSDADSTYRSDVSTLHDKDMIMDGKCYRFYILDDRPEDDSVRFVFDIREVAPLQGLAQR